MESAELNQNGDNIEDLSAEQFLSRDSSNACGVFGEPELLPRVGDGYQAEIPALITGPEYNSYLKRLVDAENKDHVPFDFRLGLSVPVTWIRNIKMVKKNKKDVKLDFSTQSTDAPLIFGSVRETINPCYGLVPGVCCDLWNDIEAASFVLGLYLFKKKFVQLKKFIGTKKMGDVLFFYYTKFYRSTEFNRWSTCSKGRNRKCAYGKWLFSDLRQQELLSRLLPQVSKECQKMLREVTRTYAKKDMSLIEYVFSLKSMVGLETFVDAVAIGKGKQDLTSMVIRPVRIPVGEACSNLTHAEIANFLSGGYCLSKSQSSDIFWEAVWPRLLARGWHSEQPKTQAYVQSEIDSLVFLTPGVEKFSRKLVKGNHYFDSVADVLSKVGSEPELFELDTENDEGVKKEEKGLNGERKEQQNFPKKRSCYLQPQTPISGMDVMKFIVIDTSLGNGKVLKFRELKTLPMDMSEMKIVSKDSDEDTSNVSTIKSDCAHNMLVVHETNSTTHAEILPDTRKLFDCSSDQLVRIYGTDTIEPVKKAKKQKKLYDNNHAREPVHIQLSQKLKRNNCDTLLSVTKRHRTTAACSDEEIGSGSSTFPLVPKFGDRVHGCCSDVLDPNSNAFSQVGSSIYSWASTTSPKGNPCWSTRGSQDDNCHDQENSRSCMFIDLNLPQQPVDFPGGVYLTDSTNMQDDITSTQQDDFCAQKTSADISVPEQATHMTCRRQSTRNRPPTARALEALVNGDLTAKTRRKKNAYASSDIKIKTS